MISVERDSKNIEHLIKEFKRKVSKSQIVKEVRNRQEYIKPSVVKRKMLKDAKYRFNKYGK